MGEIDHEIIIIKIDIEGFECKVNMYVELMISINLKTFLTWKLNDKGKESRFQARGTHRSLSLFSISCPVQQTMNARTK